jgi:hypothetical protein
MKEVEEETFATDIDLDIEVLDGHKNLLVVAAGCTCSGHRTPIIKIIPLAGYDEET